MATITLDNGAAWIYHETTQRFIPVKFSVRGRDLGSTVAEAQARIAKNVKLPSGYRIIWAGEFEDLQQAKERLEIIVPVSLVLIVGLLYCLFNSNAGMRADAFRDSVRLRRRRAGALCLRAQFQHLRRHRLRLAVRRVGDERNSAHHLLQPGPASRRDARGGHVPCRLDPDATAADDSLSACIGLFPAAISTGIGGQVQRPLATVIVGGMLVGPSCCYRRAGAEDSILGRSGDKSPTASSVGVIGVYEDSAFTLQ